MVNVPTESKHGLYMRSIVPIMLKILAHISKLITVVVASSTDELIAKLAVYDFAVEGLPECLGGNWSYDEDLTRWQEARIRYEWELPPADPSAVIPHIPQYEAKSVYCLSREEKDERKRRLNVLNSRRKRNRKRVAVVAVSNQVLDLRKRNRHLMDENERLEGLLKSALATVKASEKHPEQDVATDSRSLLDPSSVSSRNVPFQGELLGGSLPLLQTDPLNKAPPSRPTKAQPSFLAHDHQANFFR